MQNLDCTLLSDQTIVSSLSDKYRWLLSLFCGTLCLVTCFAYPLGWSNNTEISQICGSESGSYQLGRCEVGWAYVLAIACGVISVVLSGMPNILQSLLQRNTLPPMVTPSDAKYSFIPPSHSHPHLPPPWNSMENSVFMGDSGGGVNYYARRRPHSLVVPSDSSTLLDPTRRLSCSVFCPIAEQEQAGLPPTKHLECQSFAAIPEDEVAIGTAEENNNELHDDGRIASTAGIAS